MPIYAPFETLALLGTNAERCVSRGLFKDRFADPQAREDARKRWFNTLIGKPAESPSVSASWWPQAEGMLYARLMSRLVVGLANGVMENANLTLDRYGLPIIPGSAIKGCARRMALQSLHDWIAAGTDRPSDDDACASCCKHFKTPIDMLAVIARVFGWTPEDWRTDQKDGHWKSDLAWACGSSASTRQNITVQGNAMSHANPMEPNPEWAKQQIVATFRAARALLPDHDTFAGTIAFLAASPKRDPGLELDVVTPHHTEYYQSKGKFEIATDTEDPVPVYFPVVKPQGAQDYFTFPLIPLSRAVAGDLASAKNWLSHGLQLFGLGAKTAAGYGYFDVSEDLQTKIKTLRETELKSAERKAERKAQEENRSRETELRRQKKDAETKALEGLSPEEQDDWKVAQIPDPQLESKLKNFCKEPKKGGPSEAEKSAIIRALKGPRIELWKQFKAKATKGSLATSAAAIHTLNNKLHGNKMP